MYNKIKTDAEIEAIRRSGEILGSILKVLTDRISAGMTGLDIDKIAMSELKGRGGLPAFLGYHGFPSSICISVNDAVVHGIPNSLPFKDGDVVGLDFGVIYDGMITDAARTVIVGNPNSDTKIGKLVSETKRSLDMAIGAVKSGASVGDISAAAQKALDRGGYGIVRDLVGHGVGHHVHEGPDIPNYGHPGTGPKLRTGMTLAIEPMATLGTWQVVMDPDGWTIRSRDGSISAHFEDTVLVTEDGCEILTRP